jgi:hypothetical protein
MATKGAFGYIIGRKKRLMTVEVDADLLWQILVREIYILMNHYTSKEEMQTAFEKIKTPKGIPKLTDTTKFKMFSDFESQTETQVTQHCNWSSLLHYCQSSYINILECGYIVNQKNQNEEKGLLFMLDFNKGIAVFYNRDVDGKEKIIQRATLEEIMNYEEMPTNTYTKIVSEMKGNFTEFYEKYERIESELKNLKKLKEIAKTQNAVNIEEKVNKLIDDMNWEKKKLNTNRRVFYERLKALNLIDDTK